MVCQGKIFLQDGGFIPRTGLQIYTQNEAFKNSPTATAIRLPRSAVLISERRRGVLAFKNTNKHTAFRFTTRTFNHLSECNANRIGNSKNNIQHFLCIADLMQTTYHTSLNVCAGTTSWVMVENDSECATTQRKLAYCQYVFSIIKSCRERRK